MIPVGPDQLQHLEFTIDLAKKINSCFGKPLFTIPSPVLAESKIRSLANPLKKMSKSDLGGHSCIFIDDDPLSIRTKISRAVTDSVDTLSFDEGLRPGVSSLIQLYSLVGEVPMERVISEYAGVNKISKFKADLAELVIARFSPMRSEFQRIMKDPSYIEETLAQNSEKAREIAAANFRAIKGCIFES